MRIFEIGQIVQYLQDLIEADAILGDLWVTGEVSNFTRSSAGHCYFTLKDARSQLRCAFFRGAIRAYLPGNGDAVIAHGRVSVYQASGNLELIVDLVQPEGVGVLHLQYEYLKQRLEDEGLFDPARKRPLPEFPRRIGLVTSPTGAVLQDIWQVLGRRYPYVEVLLAPTLVQGEGAAPRIVAALDALNQEPDIDLIVVARGGGSLEDLWPFNEESVARAIFKSRVPVVSAIGHETDVTIADYVADVRAPTPSAAAELIVPDARVLWREVAGLQRTLDVLLEHRLTETHHTLDRLARRLQPALPDLGGHERLLGVLSAGLERAMATRLAASEHQVATRLAQLEALSPRRTLDRGYAVVSAKSRPGPLRDPAATVPGEPLVIQLSQGILAAEVAKG